MASLSAFSVSHSMSTNTGVSPFSVMAEMVVGKPHGETMTPSPSFHPKRALAAATMSRSALDPLLTMTDSACSR